MNRLLTRRYVVPSVVALALLPWLLPTSVIGYTFPFVEVLLLVAVGYGFFKRPVIARRIFGFVFVALVLLFAAGVDYVAGADMKVGNVGVLLVGASSILFMGAALSLLNIRRPKHYRDGLVDALAAVVGVASIQWQFQVDTETGLKNLGELMIPVFCGVIIFGVLVIVWRLMFDQTQNRAVALGIVATATFQSLSLMTSRTYTDSTPPLIAFSFLYLATYFIAASLLHKDFMRLCEEETTTNKRPPVMRWLGPAAALVVSPGMLFMLLAKGEAPGLLVAVAAFVLTFVVLWRIGRLLTERENGRKELTASEQRFRSLVQNTADIIAVLDTDRRVTYLSGGFEELLGFPAANLMGKRVTSLLDPVDIDNVRQGLINATEPGVAQPMGRDIRLRRPDGAYRWVSVMVTNQQHNPSIGGWVLNVHDVTERKLAEEELSRLALHDSLTGLPNRSQLRNLIATHISGDPGRTALLFCDLDGFKAVNDLLGHEMGDEVLRSVAGRWSSELRAHDLLGRWGGDEFLVVCPNVSTANEAAIIADRLIAALAQPLKLHNGTANVGCSIGLAVHEHGESLEDLIGRADVAMYDAKRASGGLRLSR